MTRREWLELKSRVKITRGDNYLLIAFWGKCCSHGGISTRYRSGGYYLKRSFIESNLA
jgi:hypothetical protein